MPSIINALTASGGGVSITGDATGNLALQTAGNTAVTVNTSKGVQFDNCIGVGNATPSTSGVGITFPATQSASSDANTLDDYEEGTWTPSLGGNTTYSIQQGTYTKVGRFVTVNFDVSVTTLGTGNVTIISGLPFTSASGTSNAGSVAYFTGIATSCYSLILRNDAATATVNVYPQNAQSTAIGSGSVFANSARVLGSISYMV